MTKTNIFQTGIGYFSECSQALCTHLIYRDSMPAGDFVVSEYIESKLIGGSVIVYRRVVYASKEAEFIYSYLDGMADREATVPFYWTNWVPVKQYVPEPLTIDEIKEQLTF